MGKKVIIIGAGIAGISAAMELVENGYEVNLFETSSRAGGRMFSLLDNKSKDEIDNGQHLFIGAYKHFFNILKKLDTFKFIANQKSLKVDFFDIHNGKSTLNTGILPSFLGLILGLALLKNISLKSKYKTVQFLRKLKVGNLKYNGLTAYELLISEEQEIDIIEKFWKPFVVATMNISINYADAETFLNILKITLLGKKSNSKLLFSKVGLSILVKPFQEWLNKNKGQIFFGNRIEKINFEDDKVVSVKWHPFLPLLLSTSADKTARLWYPYLKA